MVKTITLKFAGTCKACGASLPVGAKARWTGRGRVFGLSCHSADAAATDDIGLRWERGRAVQANGLCEDAPACGCCGQEWGSWTM
jgi:hypothetical protein